MRKVQSSALVVGLKKAKSAKSNLSVLFKQKIEKKKESEIPQDFEKKKADHTLSQFTFIRRKIEEMSHSQIAWFINEKELLNSQAKLEVDKASLKAAQSSSLSNLLSFLFIFRSQLEHPYKYESKDYLEESK